MSLNDLRNEFGNEIQSAAEELSNSLPLSRPQLRSAFTDSELTEIHKMIKAVNEAADENAKSAKIGEYASSAFKLLQNLGGGI